jgi:hypothetical protein
MHFVANKICDEVPLPPTDAVIPKNIFSATLEKVTESQDHFLLKENLLHKKIDQIVKSKELHQKRVVVFGAGTQTELLMNYPEFKNIQIQYIVDNSVDKQKVGFHNIAVYPPSSISHDIDYIIISSKSFEDEMFDQLQKIGVESSRIIKI